MWIITRENDLKVFHRRKEEGKWQWSFRRENQGFAGINPWIQHGQLESYGLKIIFSDFSGRLDHYLNVLGAGRAVGLLVGQSKWELGPQY